MAAAIAVPAFVPLDEYLHTMYHPDMDYVDGVLEERNLGENQHSSLQTVLAALFFNSRHTWQVKTFVEQRVQVSPSRFRIPDLCVMPASWKNTPIIREAPLLCIEILSPDDRFKRIQARCGDYFRMGVPAVWIFDPEERLVYVLNADNTHATHHDGALSLPGTAIELSLPEVFSVLDDTPA